MTHALVSVSKPARKSASTKPAQKPAKPATKPAQKAQEATQKLAGSTKAAAQVSTPSDRIAYALRDGFRPSAGGMLFAYTYAWLQASGLIDGGSITRARAVSIAGSTAIDYHANKTGRFQTEGQSIKLAPGAANFFADRHHDPKIREAYARLLTTGEGGDVAKNPAGIRKL